jgi:hypothetical protein
MKKNPNKHMSGRIPFVIMGGWNPYKAWTGVVLVMCGKRCCTTILLWRGRRSTSMVAEKTCILSSSHGIDSPFQTIHQSVGGRHYKILVWHPWT